MERKTFKYVLGEMLDSKPIECVDYEHDWDDLYYEYKFFGERHIYQKGKFQYTQDIIIKYDGDEIRVFKYNGVIYRAIKLGRRNYKRLETMLDNAINEIEAQITDTEE